MVEWTYFGQDRLAVGCLYKQPTGVVQEAGGCLFFPSAQPTSARADSGLRKVSQSTVNAFSYFLLRSPHAALATLVSTRESIPFHVPPFSQCFRGGKSAFYADADSTKPQRSACAGSNYAWIEVRKGL